MDTKISTYSFRLPEQLKLRLERSAEAKNMSFNQFLIDIINRYYCIGGFINTSSMTSVSGRDYDIHIEESRPHPPDQPTCFFYLRDPLTEKTQTYYTIGLTRSVLENLGISEKFQYTAILEVGLALLHYYHRIGQEISTLRWNQFPSYPKRRVLDTNDLISKGVHINSLEVLLQSLKTGEENWRDRYLLEPLSINNGLWNFSGQPLGYIVEDNFFDENGRHVGVIVKSNNEKQIFSIKGRYVGHVIRDRLLVKQSRSKSQTAINRLPAKYPLVTSPKAPLSAFPSGFSVSEPKLETLEEIVDESEAYSLK